MCTKCYAYWLSCTPPGERPVAPRFARQFWDAVRKDGPTPAHAPHLGPCWIWTGPHDRKGYGGWRGHALAHRHSWQIANGPLSDDLMVCHHCDNPPCVNPGHLYPGTAADNARDAVERGRNYVPEHTETCNSGHAKAGDNLLLVVTNGRQSRACRTCYNERSARRQREARQARGLWKTKLSDADRATILSLRSEGLPHRKIAREVGRSLMAVQTVLKENGA
jgi:hypothetical protein